MQYVWSRQRNLLRSRQRSGLSTEQCFSWLKSSPDVNTLTRYTATEYRCIQNIAVSNNAINCAKPSILNMFIHKYGYKKTALYVKSLYLSKVAPCDGDSVSDCGEV